MIRNTLMYPPSRPAGKYKLQVDILKSLILT